MERSAYTAIIGVNRMENLEKLKKLTDTLVDGVLSYMDRNRNDITCIKGDYEDTIFNLAKIIHLVCVEREENYMDFLIDLRECIERIYRECEENEKAVVRLKEKI